MKDINNQREKQFTCFFEIIEILATFQTLSAILGPPSGHFGFCRRGGVAGGELVPSAPLGWYCYR